MKPKNFKDFTQEELAKIIIEERERNKKKKEELRKQRNKLLKIFQEENKKKPKSFQEYYQECIKGKDIPKDAPEYFKRALKKAKKEYEKGIILERSLLSNFADKFTIKGKPEILPKDYFEEKIPQIKDFLGSHLKTHVLMILICEMEKQENFENMETGFIHHKAYFQSGTHIIYLFIYLFIYYDLLHTIQIHKGN